MRRLFYSMGLSLDGFITDRDGTIAFTAPDEELHRFHNELGRETGVHLYGRRLWETMAVWETYDQEPGTDAVMREWAELWRALPKVVFSRTLESVSGSNVRLVTGDAAEEVARLKAEPGEPLSVGGAGLASSLIAAGLVDEYRLFVYPVILGGGGTPFFPLLEAQVDLELVETRTFAMGVVYLRYVRAGVSPS
jgi:dihydrofolate reductase